LGLRVRPKAAQITNPLEKDIGDDLDGGDSCTFVWTQTHWHFFRGEYTYARAIHRKGQLKGSKTNRDIEKVDRRRLSILPEKSR